MHPLNNTHDDYIEQKKKGFFYFVIDIMFAKKNKKNVPEGPTLLFYLGSYKLA